MIFASDSALNGGGEIYSFRIKIWQEDDTNGNEDDIYDNDVSDDGENSLTSLDDGSIRVHKKA
jgi:hypothetical protein